jgi:hypothetical protein
MRADLMSRKINMQKAVEWGILQKNYHFFTIGSGHLSDGGAASFFRLKGGGCRPRDA